VSPDLQRYKCFGCGVTGDIFNFVQDIENIDFSEALEKLAKLAGVELKKQKPNSLFKTLEEINYLATKYYYNELKKNKIALEYLRERGFNQESIKTFGIGYSPENPNLRNYLYKNKKYTNKELLDSGLFVQKDTQIKEKFYNRIMFPIRSKKGTVLAFTARVLPGNDWGPKYMNSPDTPIFHKKDNVFGQYESRQEIRKLDLAILCEGSTDVISAHQKGIKNIVAPLGTGLTKEQLQNLSSSTKNFLFFFDSDEAGKNALIRAFKIASELRLNPYAANAKPYKDIDELLQNKPEGMQKLIENKKEAFSFILSEFIADKNINKLEDLNRIRTFIGSLLDSVADDTTKDHYVKKVSNLTKIDLRKNQPLRTSKEKDPEKFLNVLVKETDNKLEREYLQLLLLSNNLEKNLMVPPEYITSPNLSDIYKVIYKREWKNKEEMYNILKEDEKINPIFENIIFNLVNLPTKEEDIVEEITVLAKRLKMQFLKGKQKELSVKIALTEESSNYKDSEKYLKELIEINKLLKEN
jgi:DNA primase